VGKLEDNIMKSLKKGMVGKKIRMPSASGQAKLNKQLEAGVKKIMSDFMSKEKKQEGGKIMAGKTSKYRAKGGMVKRMAGGKTSKYRAKGGTVSKMGGGMIGFKKTSKYKAKGGVVSRMGGGKTSKYRAKGGRVK